MKKCPACKTEVEDDATICHSCKESFLIKEDEEILDEEPVSYEAPERKKWLKTLLLSVVSIFSVLVFLFWLAGVLDNSVFIVVSLIASLILALMGGSLLTYYEHFNAIAEKVENNDIDQYIKMAVIRLLLGGFGIYTRLSDGMGFQRGDGLEVTANNFGNFIFWLLSIFLIMDGLRNLYLVIREIISALISDEDED